MGRQWLTRQRLTHFFKFLEILEKQEKFGSRRLSHISVNGKFGVSVISLQTLVQKYNGSPMIDTPKIDTFFQISRNFRKTRKYLFKKNTEYL